MAGEVSGSAVPADRYQVRSVDKALRLVELIAAAPAEGLSLSVAARTLGSSKSTVFALLRTLEAHGFVREQQPGPRYQLGMSLMRLGDQVSARTPLVELARPVLRKLAEATGLTARIAIEDNGYPMFLDRVDGPGTVRFHTLLGRRESAHTSSAGKAIMATLSGPDIERICAESGLPRRTRHSITELPDLLADLARTKRRGYAIDDEEDAEGVFCVGAAFFDHRDRCAGALSATGIKIDLPSWRINELGATLREHADWMSELLGGRPYRIPAQTDTWS